jgi:hypothetical protein
MALKKRILLISNYEYGHSNTFLAVTKELLLFNDDLELHYASFEELEERVKEISDSLKDNSKSTTLQFHKLSGIGLLLATLRRNPELWKLYEVKSGFFNTLQIIDNHIVTMMNPYTGNEYIEVLNSILSVLEEVEPDLVVFDNALPPAMTACVKVGVKYMVLSPNTLKDLLAPTQPDGGILWKYPL